MTNGMRLRRWARTRGRRRAVKPAVAQGRRAQRGASPAVQRRFLQAAVCGVLFAVLVLLKLVLPGNLSAFRGTLAQWLVRDADFAEAFSAVGHAVTAPQRFVESMENAYVAVFGGSPAAEVSGTAEIAEAEPLPERALPDFASAEQPELSFHWSSPLSGTLTSPFGWREDPNTGAEAFHCGVDVAAAEGTPVSCFADGTVGVVGDSTELGKYVTVLHPDGCETLYAHCSRISVASGQSVAEGDKLGEVGSTGNATGAHLHFELHSGAKYVDPIVYVDAAS